MAEDEQALLKEVKEAEGVFNKCKSGGDKKAAFLDALKKILEVWRKDPTSEKVVEEMYLLTAKEVEYALNEKLNTAFNDLDDDNVAELSKFFFMTYQRTVTNKSTLSLKAAKLLPVHQELIENKGIGMLHRCLFTTEKKSKKKGEEE